RGRARPGDEKADGCRSIGEITTRSGRHQKSGGSWQRQNRPRRSATKPQSDGLLGEPAFIEIIVTTFVAFCCSIVWLYFVKFNLLTRFVQLIGATKRFGDEDVWDFTFNARDRNVE